MPRTRNEFDENLKAGHIRQIKLDENAIHPLPPTNRESRLACVSFENDILR